MSIVYLLYSPGKCVLIGGIEYPIVSFAIASLCSIVIPTSVARWTHNLEVTGSFSVCGSRISGVKHFQSKLMSKIYIQKSLLSSIVHNTTKILGSIVYLFHK
uniref:Uncharacterized protein n=1 Tax=Cacopsylla melanoneura TaxID=428564 RepID=A0A8D8LG23_9HEMI